MGEVNVDRNEVNLIVQPRKYRVNQEIAKYKVFLKKAVRGLYIGL